MTDDQLDVSEVHAFVDGHLSPDARRRIMAALAGSSDDSMRASDYHSINEALHLTYDEVLHEPLPARLRVERYGTSKDTSNSIFRRGPAQSAFALRAAALVALAFTGGLVGWSLNDRLAPAAVESARPSFTQIAAFAHQLYAPDAQYPVEVDGQEDTLLLWLSERLGTTVRVPDVQAIGFELIGGRILAQPSGDPAGLLMYENEDAKRITLTMRTRGDAPASSFSDPLNSVHYVGEENGVSIVSWSEPDLAYALIGQMDREELMAIGGLIQQELQAVPLLPMTEDGTQTPPGST